MRNQINELNNDIDFWTKGFDSVSKALVKVLKIQPFGKPSDYVRLAKSINAVKNWEKENEEAAREFSRFFSGDTHEL